jgi:carbohydrate kinase (thermoresistant glucokinase family)
VIEFLWHNRNMDPTPLAVSQPPSPVVVMGVSGSGKSLVGAALARALHADFVDSDELHSPASIDKMRRGEPLDDAERAPWLGAVANVLADGKARPNGVVVACSALKRRYRDVLRAVQGLHFVFLDAGRPLIERRFENRPGHFMPAALIASQFEALEKPGGAETDVLTVDADLPVAAAVRAAVAFLATLPARNHEHSILRSRQSNAPPWTQAIREGRVASRTLVTNRAIVDAVLALSPRRVLDVGCGEGWLSRALGNRGVGTVGVDAVDSLIAQAKELGGAAFEACSYADLAGGRFKHGDFDAAVCNFSLLGKESVEELCPALRRYLAPSGHLVIQTLHPVAACGDHPYEDGWRPGSWSGFGPEFSDPAPWYFRTFASWLALLARSGYGLIDCLEPCASGAAAPSSVIFIGRARSRAARGPRARRRRRTPDSGP